MPGYGAQGGTAKDLKPCFNEDGLGAIVNSSRGIIAAYKQEKYAGIWSGAVRRGIQTGCAWICDSRYSTGVLYIAEK